MLVKKTVKKNYICDYFIADLIITDCKGYEEIIEENCLIKHVRNKSDFFQDVDSGHYHLSSDTAKSYCCGSLCYSCYKIKNSYMSELPFNSYRKITDDEARKIKEQILACTVNLDIDSGDLVNGYRGFSKVFVK